MDSMKENNREPVRDSEALYGRLKQYADSDFYPWHMPGHKRRLVEFDNPFSIDITEIEGFDDLHHPEGILKEAMEKAAAAYGAEKTYFLVNGSSCGILAAVSAAVKPGEKLLMARNCHKSAYHGAFLQQAQVTYVYPELEEEGFYGALSPEVVEQALDEDDEIRAVIMVSPGYEGVVSDVAAIAGIVHAHGCTLIVDEAHGAHLPFAKACGLDFPASALEKGADVVIQSLHKTLPSLTQTALLHLGRGGSRRIRPETLELYLRIYQSSSPSYIFMASIDHCIRLMAGEQGKKLMKEYAENLKTVRIKLRKELHVLCLYEPAPLHESLLPQEPAVSQTEECFYDPSKFVIITDQKQTADGSWLADTLRKCYHLEPEMNTDRYVILMSSPADTKEGFDRLAKALKEIDHMLEVQLEKDGCKEELQCVFSDCAAACSILSAALPCNAPQAVMNSSCAVTAPGEWVLLSRAEGRICHDYIYIYPPGIPLLVPGERIEKQHTELIRTWQNHGLEVHGIKAEGPEKSDDSEILCICP